MAKKGEQDKKKKKAKEREQLWKLEDLKLTNNKTSLQSLNDYNNHFN